MINSPVKYSFHQKIILFVTLFFISVFYFISSCYINTSNDGSHYALVSALVNDHTLVINNYIDYTGKIDYAIKDGVYYSDRLPGNAFLMIPFFAFGNLLEFVHLNFLSRHIPIQEVTVIFLPNLCGVLGALYIFLLCKQFKGSFKISLITAIIYALCTLNFQESTHVFSHAPSMCLVLAAFYYLIKIPDIYHNQFFVFVFLLAYSIIVELQNSLLFLPAMIYIVQSKKINFNQKPKTFKVISWSVLIVATTLSVLILYNYIAFGEITLKSNKFNPEFPEEQSFLTSLSGDFISGIDRLFTNFLTPHVWFNWESGVKNDIPGVLITSPILLVSLYGFVPFFKKHFKEAILFLSIILINVMIGSFHKTVLVRHIFTITPFLFFPLFFVLNSVSDRKNKFIVIILLIILAMFSAFRVFYVTHSYWGRDINNIFPFVIEFKVYFVFLIFVSLIYVSLFYKRLKIRSLPL